MLNFSTSFFEDVFSISYFQNLFFQNEYSREVKTVKTYPILEKFYEVIFNRNYPIVLFKSEKDVTGSLECFEKDALKKGFFEDD